MTTPSASELLVQQAQEAERLRLLLLANECKDLDEFRRRLQDLLCRIAAAVKVDFVSRIWAAGLLRSRPRWIRAASDPKRRELRPGLSGAGREAFPVIIHKGKHEEICLCKCIIKEQLIRRPGTALCRLPLRADVKNVLHSFPLATTTSSV